MSAVRSYAEAAADLEREAGRDAGAYANNPTTYERKLYREAAALLAAVAATLPEGVTVEQVVAENEQHLPIVAGIAADRDNWYRAAHKWHNEVAAIQATLPDCPRCAGTGFLPGCGHSTSGFHVSHVADCGTRRICPDCSDGKVTVAQMAALWEAVHAAGKESALIPVVGVANFATKEHHGASVMLDHLRQVRP